VSSPVAVLVSAQLLLHSSHCVPVSLAPGDLFIPCLSHRNTAGDRWLSMSTTKIYVADRKLYSRGEHVFLKYVICVFFLHMSIAVVSFNCTDKSDTAEIFALRTSHCTLLWSRETALIRKDGRGFFECLLETSTRGNRVCTSASILCRNHGSQTVVRCPKERHKNRTHFTEDFYISPQCF
jgi:hypothetical protein